jgi:hypothetical protein
LPFLVSLRSVVSNKQVAMQLGLAYLDAKLILSELSGQRVKKYINNSFFEKEEKILTF